MPRRRPTVKLTLTVQQAQERRDKPGHDPIEGEVLQPSRNPLYSDIASAP
jgi:hypothetical protein